MADSDYATLLDLKTWLGLTAEGADEALQKLLTAAISLFKQVISRDLMADDYVETRNGYGGRTLALSAYPVIEVTGLTIDGNVIQPALTQTSAGFVHDAFNVYLRGYTFPWGVQNITVNYRAGLAAIPPEVSQAVISLAGYWWKNREHIGQVSKIINGETVSFQQYDLTPDVKLIAAQYKRVIPI